MLYFTCFGRLQESVAGQRPGLDQTHMSSGLNPFGYMVSITDLFNSLGYNFKHGLVRQKWIELRPTLGQLQNLPNVYSSNNSNEVKKAIQRNSEH